MLIDNILFLKKNYPRIREDILAFEEQIINETVKVVDSKSGKPTLEIMSTNGVVYLHSKYDPEKEAQRFIEQYKQSIQEYDHVFFYGIGLGYHIEAFMARYPDMTFTMYEPTLEVMSSYLKIKRLENLPTDTLNTVHLETPYQGSFEFLRNFTSNMNQKILLIPLPSYERIFKEKYESFIKQFKMIVKNSRSELHTTMAYQRRWTVNTVKNLSKVYKTPNILKDVDKKYFMNKPGIIVSAGPSLTKEIDNLKYIKENGLAYIFSVGSAINTLIEYGILPDAACTYDPTEKNQKVFEKLKEKGIKEVPLIFGSSVGYETLENYPGLMFHMITSQDKVSHKLLDGIEKTKPLLDAPSIAIVTYQLMLSLGFSQIILVGQNLAFKDAKRYAEGIDYGDNSNIISDNERQKLILVEDVYGNDVQTSEGYLRMKNNLELYTESNMDVETINTTKGGANIKGAPFMNLDEVIKKKLLRVDIVDNKWEQAVSNYDLEYTIEQFKIIKKNKIELYEHLENIFDLLKKIKNEKVSNYNQFEKKLNKFDKLIKKITKNDFYLVFIAPMVRVQNENLVKNSRNIKYESDISNKINMITQHYGNFISDILEHYHFISSDFYEVEDILYKDKKRMIK